MISKQIGVLRRILFLLPISLLWLALDQYAVFDSLHSAAMNLAFRVRGEIQAPVKVVYANLDGRAVSMFGERPWDRAMFADVTKILFEVGKAKAVGYDFIFSSLSASSNLIPVENLKKSDLSMAEVVRQYPNLVLAGNYTGIQLPPTPAEQEMVKRKEAIPLRTSVIPLFHQKLISYRETYPETPTFPVIDADVGTVGLISTDEQYRRDVIPRWVPLYAPTDGPYRTLFFMEGYRKFLGLPQDNLLFSDEEVVLLGADGSVVKTLPLNQKKTFYHFGVELARMYLNAAPEAVSVDDEYLRITRPDGTVAIQVPLTERQIVEINWFSRWDNADLNPMVSIADLFQQYTNLTRDEGRLHDKAVEFFKQFEGAIVLVGPVDPTLQDLAPTPFDPSPKPKVAVHGNLLKTMFSGRYIHRLPWWATIPTTLCLTLGVASLALYSGRFSALAKLGSIVVLTGFIAGCFAAFSNWDVVLPLIVPVGAAFTTSFVGITYQLLHEERQRSRIKGMFGTYLSPTLVNRMVESGEEPKLGGSTENITCFFSDIQNFSTFSEVLDSAHLVELMNEYLTAMTDILQEEGGTLDKYIGDAIIGIFGAPVPLKDHALRACVGACRVQQRQAELRQLWADSGGKWPQLVTQMRTRIGLNTGPATVGNMGSRTRFNYTMMGDTVNLGARCESGAKAYGVYIMVTEDTKVAAEKAGGDLCAFRYLDRIVVKGRAKPVAVYEVMGLRASLKPETLRCLDLFEQGIKAYLAQDWDTAYAAFEKSAEFEPNQPDHSSGIHTNPSVVMRQRCLDMKNHPPGRDWDGVYVMKTK